MFKQNSSLYKYIFPTQRTCWIKIHRVLTYKVIFYGCGVWNPRQMQYIFVSLHAMRLKLSRIVCLRNATVCNVIVCMQFCWNVIQLKWLELPWYFYSRAAKPIHCAQNVKTVSLCTEFNKNINNIFLICHILWHLHVGQKLKHAPISLKIRSNCLSCHKDSKNVYSKFNASPMLGF